MNWLLLDDSSEANRVSHTIQQLACAIVDEGDKCKVINTMHKGFQVPEKEVASVLHNLKPDAVMFLGPCGLRFIETFLCYPNPCINLWFDDPLLRVGVCGLHDKMQNSFMIFEHFMWDGYWRDRAKEIWNLPSRPIHLAASSKEFYESKTVFNEQDIIFIGNLHSPREIEKMMDKLPPTYISLIRDIDFILSVLPDTDNCPSWDKLLKQVYEAASLGEQKLILAQNERSDEVRGNAQWIVWAKCKNFVRIRMLKKALQVGSVRMFSETEQLFHASESEVRGLLGEWRSRLAFHPTDGLSFSQLAEVYHHGWIHIQATDPQSVAGGIPYRVFQTAASARPLLSDKRPELLEAFEDGKEFIGYENVLDFEHQLNNLSKSKNSLRDIGHAARERLIKEHTWSHRINYLKKCFFFETREFTTESLVVK